MVIINIFKALLLFRILGALMIFSLTTTYLNTIPPGVPPSGCLPPGVSPLPAPGTPAPAEYGGAS